MSWYRQIKIINIICSNTFYFILWAIAVNGIIGGNIDFRLYLLSLASSFLAAFLLQSVKNTKLAPVISFIIAAAILFLMYGRASLIINALYLVFIIFMTDRNETEDINYELYKQRAEQAIACLVLVGLIFIFVKLPMQQYILKFYLIFLISVSILMREGRNYYYRIRNKRSYITNFAVAVGIVFLSLDKVFNIVVIILGFIAGLFNRLADKLLELLAFIIQKPLVAAINFLGKRMLNKQDLFNNIMSNKNSQQLANKVQDKTAENFTLPHWIIDSLRLGILLLIIFIVYKAAAAYKTKVNSRSLDSVEERIKLTTEKVNNENPFKRAVKNILFFGELKDQAIHVYRKFQIRTNQKGIFKTYMTAKQLENVTKAFIDNPEGMDDLTKIYNEAKFSNHSLTKDQLDTIKNSYNKIKKQL